MKEIKFRGKTACCQLATAKDVRVYGGVHSIFENDDTCYISVNNYLEKNKAEKLLVNKNTVGQYNGDNFINKGIIEYNDENCCFNVTERITVELEDVLYKDNDSLEVIGNIYDNPDLLEKGAEDE